MCELSNPIYVKPKIMDIKSQFQLISISLCLLVIFNSFYITSGDQDNQSTNKYYNEKNVYAPSIGEDYEGGHETDTNPFQQETSPNNYWKDRVVDDVPMGPVTQKNLYETKLRVTQQVPETLTDSDESEMVVEDVRGEDDEVEGKAEEPPKKDDKDSRPNIILLLTDDQDIELGSMDYMPNTLKIFRDNGIEFRHGYVSTPMCCPSRSSMLTGMYVHNHDVYTNNDNCSSVQWRDKYEKNTFAAHLYSSGYYTSYIGKYLNKYDGYHIPYGYNEWNGLLMNSRFYNYTINRNGKRIRHENDYQNDYYPDLITNDTLDFLTRIETEGLKQPFLLVSSFPSPHGPEDAAPQYSTMFMNATPHHTPSYNFAPNLDKQWILRKTDSMTPILKQFTNLLMTKRLQTLQTVDLAVQTIFDKLKSSGLDENTYIFYTSDHGYHVGQFGLVKGKSMPYEFDIRVPFFLHGPKSMVKAGTQIHEPVMNIDLAPTFLELAGIPVPPEMDGRSLVPLIKQYSPSHPKDSNFDWKDVFLIESSGRRELPNNEGTAMPSTRSSKKAKKQREERRKYMLEDNETLRINNLCVLHPHPCLSGQKKYCRKDKDHVQFKKCRHFDFLEESFSSQLNDPLYQVIQTNSSGLNEQFPQFKKCRCRSRRNTPESIDWEIEKRQIDDEIESLKRRIEDLRDKRKEIRRKWLLANSGGQERERKGKSNQETEAEETATEDVEVGKDEDIFLEKDFDVQNFNSSMNEKHQPHEDMDHEEKDHVFHASEESDDDQDQAEEEPEEDQEDFDQPNLTSPTLQSEIITEDPITTTIQVPTESSYKDDYRDILTYNETEKQNLKTLPHTQVEQIEEDELVGLDFEGDFQSFSKYHIPNRKRNRNKFKNRNNRPKKYPDLTEGLESEDEDEDPNKCDCSNDPRWIRKKEREERKRKKLISKLRKKQKYMRRIHDPEVRKLAETCGTEEKMNCFWHDNDHWKTQPYWDNGSFCFCMNSNNNTYSCLRSVNATHNYLYCQFITGFKMYFDLRTDPFQLKNVIGTLAAAQEDWMLVQLIRLKKCKGREECWAENDKNDEFIQSSIWEQIFGRWPKKKRRGNKRRQH